MCLIIANFGEAKEVTKTVFNDAKKSNPDGIGIMAVVNGKFRIKKFVTDDEQKNAYKYYLSLRAIRPAVNIVIHFRYATHGTVNTINCHPFKVNPELYMCHNGILSIDQPKPEFSDTWHFNRNVLSVLPVGFEKLQAYKLLIESFIDYSKLAFLNANGDIYLHNSQLGGYDKGNWYSNTRYKCSPKPDAVNSWEGFTTEGKSYKYEPAYWWKGTKYTDYESYRAAMYGDATKRYSDGTKDADISDVNPITSYKDNREKELLQERESKRWERYTNNQWRPIDNDNVI